MTPPTFNDHQRALVLAKTIAQLARVNTAIDKLSIHTCGTDRTIGLDDADVDADLMLAEAEDDIWLGMILFEAVERVAPDHRRRTVMRSCARAPRGIAKRPRHISGGRTTPARWTTRHDAVLNAARVLRRALQKRFPLTWPKLLEEE